MNRQAPSGTETAKGTGVGGAGQGKGVRRQDRPAQGALKGHDLATHGRERPGQAKPGPGTKQGAGRSSAGLGQV